jgi:hypothetical protein
MCIGSSIAAIVQVTASTRHIVHDDRIARGVQVTRSWQRRCGVRRSRA